MKVYVKKRDYKAMFTQTVFNNKVGMGTVTGTPNPSWQSSDWSANYVDASTDDNSEKRYYYKTRYRRWR